MVRVKRYIDANVLEEAKRRIGHIMDVFDSVVVSFSGGKDSLVVLHLVHEVMVERGDTRPVNVNFYDEELIPDTVIDFVDSYRRQPWVNMTWLAVPMASQKFILGDTQRYVQWDPSREHVRPKPAWALTQQDLGIPEGRVISQYEVETFLGARYPGRVAILNGIRADESITRWRASVNKLHENYINAGSTAKTAFCKPIFDWSEADVFRYFYDRGIVYCHLYDRQMFAGQGLRVSTPLHAESAKRFHYLREVEPTFYDQLVSIFPEMLVHERYYRDLTPKQDVEAEYLADGDAGIFRYINERISDPVQRSLARRRVRDAIHNRPRAPGLFEPSYLLRQVINGNFKRVILPEGRKPAEMRRKREAKA